MEETKTLSEERDERNEIYGKLIHSGVMDSEILEYIFEQTEQEIDWPRLLHECAEWFGVEGGEG